MAFTALLSVSILIVEESGDIPRLFTTLMTSSKMMKAVLHQSSAAVIVTV